MGAELSHHLGYAKGKGRQQKRENQHNGYSPKRVRFFLRDGGVNRGPVCACASQELVDCILAHRVHGGDRQEVFHRIASRGKGAACVANQLLHVGDMFREDLIGLVDRPLICWPDPFFRGGPRGDGQIGCSRLQLRHNTGDGAHARRAVVDACDQHRLGHQLTGEGSGELARPEMRDVNKKGGVEVC